MAYNGFLGCGFVFFAGGQRSSGDGKTEGGRGGYRCRCYRHSSNPRVGCYQVKVFLVEKYPDVACGCTKAHSYCARGLRLRPDLKAKLNVRGAAVYPQVCQELEVEFKPTSLVVALAEVKCPA